MAKTCDLTTNAGLVMLLHTSDAQLKSDYDTIRHMEQRPGFYHVIDESEGASAAESLSKAEPSSKVNAAIMNVVVTEN